jgi:transposase-like protein
MAAAAIRDILIANQLVGEQKIARAVNLLPHADLIVAVDNPKNVERFSCSSVGRGTLTLQQEDVRMSCPRCTSPIVTKDGTIQLGGQRFRCSQCGRRFTRGSSSAFSGHGFPDDIIAPGVPLVRALPAKLRRGQRVVGRARRTGRSEHDLSLGATLPFAVWRGGPKAPRPCRSRLASG